MKPEDLGIAPFTPEPGPPQLATKSSPEAVSVLTAAENVSQKVHTLVETAGTIRREHVTLKRAYDRSQASGQRLSVENFHLKAIIAELRMHRALLFWIGI
nr:hypothetical protein [Elusimicrobiota bacterium]